jgi:hypothetical protein
MMRRGRAGTAVCCAWILATTPATGAPQLPADGDPGRRGGAVGTLYDEGKEADGFKPSRPELHPGARVRLELWGSNVRVVGHLVQADDEKLLIKLPNRGEPIELRRASIRKLEVSLGVQSHAHAGSVVGMSALGGFCVATALVTPLGNIDCEGDCGPSVGDWAGTALFCGGVTLVGGAVGALAGSAFRGERWRVIQSGRIGLRVAPTRGPGVAAAVTIRF